MSDRKVVKRVDNAILYSDGTIRVSNVRLSYPHLAEKYAGQDGKGTARYTAVGLLPKKTHTAAKDLIKAEMMKLLASSNKGKDIPPDKKCLRNGVAGTESDGHWTLNTAESKRRPTCKDRNKVTVEKEDVDEMFYGGCYVNLLIRLWWQNNDFGKRINANLIAVQFVKDGEAFGEMRITEDDIDNSFDDGDDDDNGGFDEDEDDGMDGL